MKKLSIAALILTMPLMAKATEGPYLFDFAAGKETGKAYKSLIAKQGLPGWVKNGGTSSPADIITLRGERFYALSGCKPHNCPAQSIAVLYSLDKGNIYGVYSEFDVTTAKQSLKWMNVDPVDSRDMKNALFGRL